MSWSMDAARLPEHDATRVCDVCGATSHAGRGAHCRTCAVGTLRFRRELQLLREQRVRARRRGRATEPA